MSRSQMMPRVPLLYAFLEQCPLLLLKKNPFPTLAMWFEWELPFALVDHVVHKAAIILVTQPCDQSDWPGVGTCPWMGWRKTFQIFSNSGDV